MKLLFERESQPSLTWRLSDLFPNSTHVRTERLDQSSDDDIWSFAKTRGYAIVTLNADFAERSRLYGGPPKVIWLRCGNATPDQVEAILRHHADLIIELIQNPNLDYVELL